MLFNGNFAFLQFSILFNRDFSYFYLLVNFPCYSIGISYFSIFHVIQWEFCIFSIFHVIQWEHEAQKLCRGKGRMDGRTDGRLEIHPCVLQDIGPLGPLPKKYPKCSFSTFHFIQWEVCIFSIFHVIQWEFEA